MARDLLKARTSAPGQLQIHGKEVKAMDEEMLPEVLTELDVISSYGEMLKPPGLHSHAHTCSWAGVVDSDTDTSG